MVLLIVLFGCVEQPSTTTSTTAATIATTTTSTITTTSIEATIVTTTTSTITTTSIEYRTLSHRVLFYEQKSKYKIDDEYSLFSTALQTKASVSSPLFGYIVESYQEDFSSEVLLSRHPDVLVIASLTEPLSSDELSVVSDYLMHGGRLFILGGSTDAVNQIIAPYGMTLDSAVLMDETRPVSPEGNNTEFVVDIFNFRDELIRATYFGISQIAFFGGSGIIISSTADPSLVKTVAIGSRDCYSPSSVVFNKGSQPPIAAAAVVWGEGGNVSGQLGLVFVLSDEDILTNEHLDTSKHNYDNLRFGTNIIDWLYVTEIVIDKS